MRVSEFDRICAAELTRPANATPYTTGQVIANAGLNAPLAFPSAGRGRELATGYLRSIRLLTNQSTCVAAVTVWLYNAVPSLISDGATFQNLWVERSMCLGHFVMPALAQYGNSDYALSEEWFDQYNITACAVGSNTLYAQLVTGTGFTPNSGQIFRVELGLHQNEYE